MHFLSFLTNLWENNMTLLLLILILIIVIPFLVFYLTKAKEHPKGLVAAALSNMGERFGYYIMNAVLLLFLVSKFGLPDGTAGLIYSFFYFGIYILALVGGLRWVLAAFPERDRHRFLPPVLAFVATAAAGVLILGETNAPAYTLLAILAEGGKNDSYYLIQGRQTF